MCNQLIDLMSMGMSITEAAVNLGVHRDTIYAWAESIPDFSDALKTGILHAQAWWERQGRESLHLKEFQTGLWFANMKNRFGWADRNNLEHTGKGGGPIVQKWSGGPPPMTIEEWERQVKEADGAEAEED